MKNDFKFISGVFSALFQGFILYTLLYGVVIFSLSIFEDDFASAFMANIQIYSSYYWGFVLFLITGIPFFIFVSIIMAAYIYNEFKVFF